MARPTCAPSRLIQALKDRIYWRACWGMWSEATLQGRIIARPTCAPSRLIQALKDPYLLANLLCGVERGDKR
jgi:hypothetical protein